MKYFEPYEFGGWYDELSPELKTALDDFREKWGAPVSISLAKGAVGRRDNSKSRHNVKRWGEVQAVDVYPSVVHDSKDCQRVFDIARSVGINGIGLYPQWKRGIGFHFDVRKSHASWCQIDGSYLAFDSGLRYLDQL